MSALAPSRRRTDLEVHGWAEWQPSGEHAKVTRATAEALGLVVPPHLLLDAELIE